MLRGPARVGGFSCTSLRRISCSASLLCKGKQALTVKEVQAAFKAQMDDSEVLALSLERLAEISSLQAKRLGGEIVKRSSTALSKASPDEIASVASSLARLEVAGGVVQVEQEVLRRHPPASFSPSAMALLFTAAFESKPSAPFVRHAVAAVRSRHISAFTSAELAAVLGALAKVQRKSGDLRGTLMALEKELCKRGLGGLRAEEVVSLAATLSRGKRGRSELLGMAGQQLMAMELQSQGIAQAALAFSARDATHPAFLGHLAAAAKAAGLTTFSTYNLGLLVWSVVRGEHRDEQLMREAARELVDRGFASFSPSTGAAVTWAFSQGNAGWDDLCAHVCSELRGAPNLLAGYQSKQVASVIFALSLAPPAVAVPVEALVAEVLRRDLGELGGPDLGRLLNGWVALRPSPSDAKRICGHMSTLLVRERLQSMPPRLLASIVATFAKLGEAPTDAVERVAEAVRARDLKTFSELDLGMTLWAFGRVQHAAPVLMRRLSGEYARRGARDQRALINALWGCASMGIHDGGLLARARELLAATSLEKWETHELVDLLWCFAKAKQKPLSVYGQVSEEFLRRGVDVLDDANIARLMWSYAASEYRSRDVYDMAAQDTMQRRPEGASLAPLPGHLVAQLLWSVAQQRYSNPAFADFLVASASTCSLEHLDGQSLGNMTWALGTSPSFPQQLRSAIEGEVARRGLDALGGAQEVANTLWGLAMHGSYGLLPMVAAWMAAQEDPGVVHWAQVYHAALCARMEGDGALQNVHLPPEALRAWLSNTPSTEVVGLHKEVSLALTALQTPHVNELRDEYLIDIAITHPSFGKVAVEMDGPAHYASDKPRVRMRSVKDAHLHALGWHVVSIPYYEWTSAPGARKLVYLRERLAGVGYVIDMNDSCVLEGVWKGVCRDMDAEE